MKKVFYTMLSILTFMTSCESDEDKLHEKLNEIAQHEISANRQLAKSTSLAQYKDIELKMNAAYVASLQDLVEKNFETQLEKFEENELGVIAGYEYMFKYICSNRQEWDDIQTQLSDRYFNSLIIKQKANELSNKHIKDIKNLRSQFYSSKSGVHEPRLSVLDIPKSEVFIGNLNEHSGTNLAIEIGTTILDILLGIFLVWLVVNVLGYATTGPVGCMISIVSFVIMMIISIICINYNDSNLIDSLKKQNQNISIDYDSIHKSLDQNTIQFYDKIR